MSIHRVSIEGGVLRVEWDVEDAYEVAERLNGGGKDCGFRDDHREIIRALVEHEAAPRRPARPSGVYRVRS